MPQGGATVGCSTIPGTTIDGLIGIGVGVSVGAMIGVTTVPPAGVGVANGISVGVWEGPDVGVTLAPSSAPQPLPLPPPPAEAAFFTVKTPSIKILKV
jgi:hypothetical protein